MRAWPASQVRASFSPVKACFCVNTAGRLFYCDRPGAGCHVSFFFYSALFANGFRAKARCDAKRFVVNFYLTFSVFVCLLHAARPFYCGASAGPLFGGRRLVYCSRLPVAAMAKSQGQDSSLFFKPGGYTPEPLYTE